MAQNYKKIMKKYRIVQHRKGDNIHYEVEQSKLWGMYWGVPDHNDLRHFNVNDSYSNYNCLKFTSLEDAKKVLDVVKAFDDMLSDAVKTIIAEY